MSDFSEDDIRRIVRDEIKKTFNKVHARGGLISKEELKSHPFGEGD